MVYLYTPICDARARACRKNERERYIYIYDSAATRSEIGATKARLVALYRYAILFHFCDRRERQRAREREQYSTPLSFNRRGEWGIWIFGAADTRPTLNRAGDAFKILFLMLITGLLGWRFRFFFSLSQRVLQQQHVSFDELSFLRLVDS